jgi:hypothetical protein
MPLGPIRHSIAASSPTCCDANFPTVLPGVAVRALTFNSPSVECFSSLERHSKRCASRGVRLFGCAY